MAYRLYYKTGYPSYVGGRKYSGKIFRSYGNKDYSSLRKAKNAMERTKKKYAKYAGKKEMWNIRKIRMPRMRRKSIWEF